MPELVSEDNRRLRRNLRMAWMDVRKAYDSIDHKVADRNDECLQISRMGW